MSATNAIVLHAGALRLAFSPDEGSVRNLLAGECEVLRGIAAPVRDRHWATIRPHLSDLQVTQEAAAFTVSFAAICRGVGIDFRWRGTLLGTPDHRLLFEFDGEALADFESNRIGFCVLHPAAVAGQPCRIEQIDGQHRPACFPDAISPHQPFTDIRAITHEPAPGLEAEVRFEGDIFEMEDQRNWSDASFKTYCLPLRYPHPIQVSRGTRIRQQVILRLRGPVAPAPRDFVPPWASPAKVTINVGNETAHSLPPLGTVWNQLHFSPAQGAMLRGLGLSHLRIDLWPRDRRHLARLRAAMVAAVELNVALEVIFVAGDDFSADLEKLAADLTGSNPAPRIARWIVFHETLAATPPAMVQTARTILRRQGITSPVGGGAPENFTELNRSPEVGRTADFTAYAINPQVHAFDEQSLVETLALHGTTASNAARLAGGRASAISPISFTRRWRSGETGSSAEFPAALQPFQEDARHTGAFNAAWTLGSLASLAQQPLQSATYFEAVGANGLLSDETKPHPVAETFALVAPFVGGRTFAATSSHSLHVAALALGQGEWRRLIVGNLRNSSQRVSIRGAWGDRELTLEPYAVVPCDFA